MPSGGACALVSLPFASSVFSIAAAAAPHRFPVNVVQSCCAHRQRVCQYFNSDLDVLLKFVTLHQLIKEEIGAEVEHASRRVAFPLHLFHFPRRLYNRLSRAGSASLGAQRASSHHEPPGGRSLRMVETLHTAQCSGSLHGAFTAAANGEVVRGGVCVCVGRRALR